MMYKFVIICSILVYFFNTNSSAEESNYYPEPDLTNEEHVNIIVQEMRKLFHLGPEIDNVPFYKVVPFKTVFENDDGSLEVKAVSVDDKRYKLNLTPIKHNVFSKDNPKTMIWTVDSTPEKTPNYAYKVVDMVEHNVAPDGDFYEDQENAAMLLVKKESGFFHFDGVVNEGLHSESVRFLPPSWEKIYGSGKKIKHVVFKRSADSDDDENNESEDEKDNTIYLKTLVVVDSFLHLILGSDIKETIRHISTFWNAVNMKFSELKEPNIRILLTGIIISMNETATNYVYQAIVPESEGLIKTDELLDYTYEYFKKQFIKDTGFSNYDIAVVMTPFSDGVFGGKATSDICDKKLGVAYVKSFGDFRYIPVIGHELGHLLSLPHDFCKASLEKSENMMAPAFEGELRTLWSECSKQRIKKLDSEGKYDCLKSKVHRL